MGEIEFPIFASSYYDGIIASKFQTLNIGGGGVTSV